MIVALTLGAALLQDPVLPTTPTGLWRAWLDSPGGELPFHLEFRPPRGEHPLRAAVINGDEVIDIPVVEWQAPTADAPGSLLLRFPHYDSEIRATRGGPEGAFLEGRWRKRSGLERWTEMQFHAIAGEEERFRATPIPLGAPDLPALAPRYAVNFSSSPDLAVGLFRQGDQGLVRGTFLTTLGDYRYLAGRRNGNQLLLSCFDGAHAFLFQARLLPTPDGAPRLEGDFWSSDRWHEVWTALPDPDAALADPLAEVQLAVPAAAVPKQLASLRYPDLDGNHQVVRPADADGPMLITLFGTWCPNCNDETRYLVELHQRYAGRGLDILGLAFELTGDQKRDLGQLQRYAAHHQIPYRLLLAGVADKKAAATTFPLLNQLKSYPTLLFVDRKGQIDAIWSGFSGPATGAAHQRLRHQIEQRVERLLAED